MLSDTRTGCGLGDDEGLTHIGALAHHLDVGRPAVDKAVGFEAILSGVREDSSDSLLTGITIVLDAPLEQFPGTAG